METINAAFFFVTDKIISLQAFFIGQALAMVAAAASAAGAVKSLGGGAGDQAKVFMGSIGSSAKDAALTRGGNLTRSLLARGGQSGSTGGGGSDGGCGAGINRHDKRQQFLDKPTENGEKQTYREYLQSRQNEGANRGLNYMAKKEAASASSTPESKDPDYKAAMSELNKEFPGSSSESNSDFAKASAELNKGRTSTS